jgi:predicted MFS family arabinose efflux permease
MADIGKIGVALGVIGGIGLGLMLGSEFSVRYTTFVGAGLVLISIVSMIIQSLRVKNK